MITSQNRELDSGTITQRLDRGDTRLTEVRMAMPLGKLRPYRFRARDGRSSRFRFEGDARDDVAEHL